MALGGHNPLCLLHPATVTGLGSVSSPPRHLEFSTPEPMLTLGDNQAVAASSASELNTLSLQPGWVSSLRGPGSTAPLAFGQVGRGRQESIGQ